MLLVAGADPGGPGDVVPAPNDVHDGGEARGHAQCQHRPQKVIVTPESQVQDVAQAVQAPRCQVENCSHVMCNVNFYGIET